MNENPLLLRVRSLGLVDYEPVWRAMQQFTAQRDKNSADELWLLQHPKVFTQGQAGKAEHLLNVGDIPVIQVDRGGQVTYHAPGQLVAYVLLDTARIKLSVRDLVTAIEQVVVDTLASFSLAASARADAPGVYLNAPPFHGEKIAQLGLRVRKGCTFHGLSLNVNMDMEPFQRINPCGHSDMAVTSMAEVLTSPPSLEAVADSLLQHFVKRLNFTADLVSDSPLSSSHFQ